MRSQLTTLLLGGLMAATLGSAAAQAHPRVIAADPAINGAVAASPAAVSITFSEPLFVRLCSVTVKDAAGHTVRTGASVLAPGNSRRLVTPVLSPLAPGAYSVTWHAVSADTHRVQGAYAFSVR